MKYLITGGCGFLGSNLAHEVLRRGHELCVFDNLYREGTPRNLNWLRSLSEFQFIHGDIRSYNDVERVVRSFKPDVIFHLAGQVAMTTSIEDPRLDFETNVLGGHNLLEAVRRFVPGAIITYSSTNKVYGDLERFTYKEAGSRYYVEEFPNGFDESVPLDFRSPYGCSKGAVDQYMLDYARIYGVRTIVFRHSSVFGGRQFSTFDQGWIGWFVQKALEKRDAPRAEKFTISGSGKQVRDVLFISDIVNCYFLAVESGDLAVGNAYNIGGGIKNSLSLLELFGFLERELDVKLEFAQLPWRQSDQKVFVSDNTKAKARFGWEPLIDKESGLRKMVEWISECRS